MNPRSASGLAMTFSPTIERATGLTHYIASRLHLRHEADPQSYQCRLREEWARRPAVSVDPQARCNLLPAIGPYARSNEVRFWHNRVSGLAPANDGSPPIPAD